MLMLPCKTRTVTSETAPQSSSRVYFTQIVWICFRTWCLERGDVRGSGSRWCRGKCESQSRFNFSPPIFFLNIVEDLGVVGQIRETVYDRMLSLFQAMCRSLTGAGRLFGEVTWKTRYCILRNGKDNPMGNMCFYTFP